MDDVSGWVAVAQAVLLVIVVLVYEGGERISKRLINLQRERIKQLEDQVDAQSGMLDTADEQFWQMARMVKELQERAVWANVDPGKVDLGGDA